MVDMDMDCSETDDGWFEFKSYLDVAGWEIDVLQVIIICSIILHVVY